MSPPGHFGLEGKLYPCPPFTYLDRSGGASRNDCIYCPANSESAEGSDSAHDCICSANFYLEPLSGECRDCPVGANVGSHPYAAVLYGPDTRSQIPAKLYA